VLRLPQIEVADTTDQQVAGGKVEKTPQDIHRRGGQAHSRWRCEGTLESMARDSIAEMGQGVRQECAPEEVRHIVVPAHLLLLPSYSGCQTDGSSSQESPQ